MFASIFLLTSFTAMLTSAFTADQLRHQIEGPQDLPWVRIGTVSGTNADEVLTTQGMSLRRYPFIIQACKALRSGDVDAVVYDKAILSHMIKDFGWGDIEILPHTILRHEYALAVPNGSPLRERINQSLLRIIHQPGWDRVLKRYFATE
jgi:polar amino acid transport system substrate-binding protein